MNNPRTIRLVIVSAILAFVLLMGGAQMRYLSARVNVEQEKSKANASALESYRQRLDRAELKIDALVNENESVSKRIQEEVQKRIAAEATFSANQQRLQRLESSTLPDLSVIISQWRPRVPLVQCQYTGIGFVAVSSGSGVLFNHISRNNDFGVVTNRHVVNRDNLIPTQCTIIFPGASGTYTVSPNDIEIPVNGSDWAIIELTSLSSYLRQIAAKSSDRCNSNPALGNEIVILGYPSIGSQTDITATEGIISGIDGDYYITSAKVERGNSGGAAILTRQNCYAGIPTFVGTGEIESLARILNQKIIFK